jgi:hypothetical protein
MKQRQFLAIVAVCAAITACQSKSAISGNYLTPQQPYLPVTLTVQSDNQGSLREFPLNNTTSEYRAYIQATPNERYRLRVVNNSDQRVGLVIAVDGRNIISGEKSLLASNERKYILNPHDSADYDGWRTSTSQTNRFYFTEASNSYAAAWGDSSAMGVIAMVVYAERPRPQVYDQAGSLRGMRGSAAESRLAPAAAPGTGFGETAYSPVTTVTFESNPEPMQKLFLKYEWRETLCSKGILPECSRGGDNESNRLWQNQNENKGFAAPPPVR